MAKEPEKKKKIKRPTAQKRDIQNEKRRLRNRSCRSGVRTAVRKFESSLKEANAEAIKTELSNVYSLMDKAVKKGVFTKNKANRSKARMAARVIQVS